MKLFSQFLRFYFYSNLHVALCTVFLYGYTMELVGYSYDFHYIDILFFGTLIIYSIHRIVGVERVDNFHESVRFMAYAQYKYIKILVVLLSTCAAIYSFFHLDPRYYAGLSVAVLLSLGYALPVFPDNRRLRDFNYIKVFLIGLVWSMLTATIPNIVNDVDIYMNIGITVERCLFILAITIPFDIRDYSIDQDQQVATIPSLVGKEKAKKIALILNALGITMVLYNHWQFDMSHIYIWTMTVTYIISGLLIYYASENKHDYYYTGLLDGMMMLPFLLWLLFGVL